MMENVEKPKIYLDSHATTRVDQDVLNEMLPWFTQHYGSGNHRAGWKSNTALENARHQVSCLIGARPTEIIFTSGATESTNLALFGLAKSNNQKRNHIVTQVTEHPAVLRCIERLELKGYRITKLPVDAAGRINIQTLEELVTEDTLLVAIMLANNEIGTVQPIKEIGVICRNKGAKFFCDLTQGLGWHPVNVDEMNIDLAAMSAHKIYGPRGVGALFVRRKYAKVNLSPLVFGGGQERGIRPGTVNIPGVVGFGKAIDILIRGAKSHTKRIRSLRDHLQNHLLNAISGIQLNGCPINRHPGNLNIAIPGVSGEKLLGALPNIIFSTGSACSSGSTKSSHVISALGKEKWVLKNTLRLGIGKYNTMNEMEYVGQEIVKKAEYFQQKCISRF